MIWSSTAWRILIAGALVASMVGVAAPRAEAQKPKIIKSKPTPAPKKTDDEASVEPDKVLYDRAMKSVKQRRYTEARLDLQTLINTYPDSEYLAKAKLSVADSYYKEGGTSNLTQAIEEYKNFIVFFPFLDEAAYAQIQVAMAHYRMMEKADRDSSQALDAEQELQAFLQKYPQSKLYPQAEQNLRNVQEVLADGEFRIARFYYVKTDYRASAARLVEVTERYPLYSQGDEALWMLGDVYMRAKTASKNEDDKNHWADLAGKCYTRIVTDYPLSKWASAAKHELQGMGMPVPTSNPAATARMQKNLAYERDHKPGMISTPTGMFRTAPDVTYATREGAPNLNPPDDAVSATEVLKPGAVGPSFGVASAGSAGSDSGGGGDSGTAVTTVDSSSDSSSSSAAGNSTGVQILEAPSGPAPDASAQPTPQPAPDPNAPASSAAPAEAAPSLSSIADSSGASSPANSGSGAPAGAAAATATPGSADSTSAQGQSTNSNASSSQSSGGQGESTSKKKKGLHKIIPF